MDQTSFLIHLLHHPTFFMATEAIRVMHPAADDTPDGEEAVISLCLTLPLLSLSYTSSSPSSVSLTCLLPQKNYGT